MHQTNNTYYRQVLSEKLSQYYSTQQVQKPDIEQRDELNRFMSSALLLNTIGRDELKRVINAQHLKAFGKSIKQHRLDLLDPGAKGFSWDYFDTPVWAREQL